jgi:ubiquinone biosynthesis protein COQ9
MNDGSDHLVAERVAILNAALTHVPFDGWSLSTLREGAREAGLDETMVARAFPGGVRDAIDFWSRMSDTAMLLAYEAADTEAMRFRERITFLVRARIEAVTAHREAVRRALTHVSRPSKMTTGLRGLYRTVDEMWYAAGDRSTDFSFYTKRGTLAGVYGSTLLFWLDDRSEDFSETWTFLDRRIADVMRIPQKRASLRDAAKYVPNPGRFARRVAQHLREGRAR